MIMLYHLITGLGLVAASPFLLVKLGLDPQFRLDLQERLGSWKSLPQFADPLWVHASSVGEVRVARVLIQGLLRRFPDRQVVLSTFTRTGYHQAKEFNLCPVFRLPPDFLFFTRPLVRKLNPALLILIEAEFWPGLLHECRERGIPVLLVNGRLSRKSFRRYRLMKPLFHWMVSGVQRFAMRSELDAGRMRKLGLPAERVEVTGNMKFDALPETEVNLSSRDESRLIVFGSTRPGDEGPILDAITRLNQEDGSWRYVLAPRHPQRADEVEALILNRGLHYKRFSELENGDGDTERSIVLVDEIGHLNDFYRQSRLAFVGGGFSPEFGGQNILEPALYGVPVVFGPHMDNFAEEARLLAESGGGIQLKGPEDLYPTLHALLAHPEEITNRGKLAAVTVRKHRGALDRNLRLIEQMITPSSE